VGVAGPRPAGRAREGMIWKWKVGKRRRGGVEGHMDISKGHDREIIFFYGIEQIKDGREKVLTFVRPVKSSFRGDAQHRNRKPRRFHDVAIAEHLSSCELEMQLREKVELERRGQLTPDMNESERKKGRKEKKEEKRKRNAEKKEKKERHQIMETKMKKLSDAGTFGTQLCDCTDRPFPRDATEGTRIDENPENMPFPYTRLTGTTSRPEVGMDWLRRCHSDSSRYSGGFEGSRKMEDFVEVTEEREYLGVVSGSVAEKQVQFGRSRSDASEPGSQFQTHFVR